MSSRCFLSRSGLFTVTSLGLLASSAYAQSQGRAAPPALDAVVISQRTAHTVAKAAAVHGDFSAAAQTLEAAGTAPVNSAARSFETAQRLSVLAGDLSRAANAVGAQAAAITALQYLAQAAQRTKDPELQAAIQSQAGFLHERYLGDTAAASAAYRAAAQLTPGNPARQEKAERFQAADTEVRRKSAQNR